MTDPDQKNPEHERRVIDFAAAKRNSQQARSRRKRIGILTAVAAVLLLLIGVVVVQFSQVLGPQDFWSNFASSASP